MRFERSWGLLAAALLLAACSGSFTTTTSDPPSPTSTSGVKPPAVTTTTSEPVSTTIPVEESEVLLPANDVDDPTEAIVAILDYVSYLHTIPDRGAEHLDLVYLETCGCHEAVLGFLAEYSENGWVQDDKGIIVSEVIISQQFENGDVLLQVTDSWAPQYVKDRSGTRIRLEDDDYTDLVSLMGLERGLDDRWRVAVIEALGEIVEGGEK